MRQPTKIIGGAYLLGVWIYGLWYVWEHAEGSTQVGTLAGHAIRVTEFVVSPTARSVLLEDIMKPKRPIDVLRDSAGSMDVGTPEEGSIEGFVKRLQPHESGVASVQRWCAGHRRQHKRANRGSN